jgi:hypothetical protein
MATRKFETRDFDNSLHLQRRMDERPKRVRPPTSPRVVHPHPQPDEPPISGIRIGKPTHGVLQRLSEKWLVPWITTDDTIERDQIT